jgi:23S rRNA (cytidine2498-2'-O)-methyltransferase
VSLDAVAYLAPRGLEGQLLAELSRVSAVHGRLVLAEGERQAAHWAQNVWLRPVRVPIESIGDAARKLRAIQRNWAAYSFRLHRRTKLIQEALPHVAAKPLEFPAKAPSAPLGSWTLLDESTVLASAECTSPFPNGEAAFVEHRVGPPTRAYLKLWEALTLLGARPREGERCLDAGASPGGWTWALARLGARVTAVDRAPLDPRVAAMDGVASVQASAFSFDPKRDGPFDWVFSDVVCYPDRLWKWVRRWLDAGTCRRFVCTLKFQGDSHYGAIRDFESVPGSRIVHLSSNKHELTWMLTASTSSPGRPEGSLSPAASPSAS